MIHKTMERTFTYLAEHDALIRLAGKVGMKAGGAYFVGGETLQESVDQVRAYNSEKIGVTLDCLGERINSAGDAAESVSNIVNALAAIPAESLDAQISFKLTSIGLRVDEELALQHLRRILTEAKRLNVFVTINMEEYDQCGRIIRLFQTMREEGFEVGIALQANLFRTERDLEKLSSLSPAVRIVKGAYKESEDVDINNKALVDENFKRLVRLHLLNGHYTQVATHDDEMIDYVQALVYEHGIPREQFEFQMLQGMREEKQRDLVAAGYRMVVYVPYGKDWYTYFVKRLAERPANIGFTLSGMLNR